MANKYDVKWKPFIPYVVSTKCTSSKIHRTKVGNPINGGPKFLYHVKHSAKPDTNHSTNPTNPTNPTTKYRV